MVHAFHGIKGGSMNEGESFRTLDSKVLAG